jgi:RNA-directed DNA polymerase
VAAFEYQDEAERFYKALGQRLGKFGLELAADKTRIIPFERTQAKMGFDFLGFEFRWGQDRAGKPHLARRTAPKKLRQSIQNFTDWCRQKRNLRLPNLFRQLNAKLRGYYNYYGLYGNGRSLHRFFQHVTEILYKWLNRRSQRHSFNWDSFKQLLDRFQIERPHIGKRPQTQPARG